MSPSSGEQLRGLRLALVTSFPDPTVIPPLVNIYDYLLACGVEVDLLVPEGTPFPRLEGYHRRRHYPRLGPWSAGLRRRWQEGGKRWRLRRQFRGLSGEGYRLVMGVDPVGVIHAARLARYCRVPLVYLSFELVFEDEMKDPADRWLAREERAACRQAALVVIQDRWRGELLSQETGVPRERLFLLPVAPRSRPLCRERDYLRRRLEIAPEQTVVLHAGSLRAWTCAQEMIESVSHWPEGFVLVIHTRHSQGPEEKRYLKLIQELDSPRIKLSTEYLPPQEYEKIVAGADLGLALYKPIPGRIYLGRNLACMGLASGKFAYYAKYGLPIVTMAQESFVWLLERYRFGAVIAEIGQLPAALAEVGRRLDHHGRESRRLFDELLDFDLYWPRLAGRLAALAGVGTTP